MNMLLGSLRELWGGNCAEAYPEAYILLASP